MMRREGFEMIAYCVGEPDNPEGWDDVVQVISPAEQEQLLGYDPLDLGSKFVGDAANIASPLYVEFNRRLKGILESRVTGDDLVAAHFGHASQAAYSSRLMQSHVYESGIGYPTCFSRARIYESITWWAMHCGKDGRNPWVSEWVVPNDFDESEWPLRTNDLKTGYVLYMGRICEIKGLNVIWQMAKARPDLEFVLAGQGDASPWTSEPNIRSVGPVHGMQRAELIHNARCMVMPTQYLEPFGGVSIEGMMTGTPVITTNHSCFLENIPQGLRANTLRDFLDCLDVAERFDPAELREYAVSKWSQPVVGKQYAAILPTIPGLLRDGFGTAEQLLEVV